MRNLIKYSDHTPGDVRVELKRHKTNGTREEEGFRKALNRDKAGSRPTLNTMVNVRSQRKRLSKKERRQSRRMIIIGKNLARVKLEIMSLLRPDILLIRTTIPHMFNQFLPLRGRQSAFLSYNLTQENVYFACHVSRVTADIKIRLLEQEVVDKGGVFSHLVLDVHLLRGFAGESSDDFERVTQLGRVGLRGEVG
jgi:hypothetical protein